MLHIIIFILKLIGWLLLGILGILLLLVITALFVPVRYLAKGSYTGKPEGSIRVTWFFRIISVMILYEEEKVKQSIRIFGIPLGRRKRKKHNERTQRKKKKPKKQLEEVPKEVSSDSEISEKSMEESEEDTKDFSSDRVQIEKIGENKEQVEKKQSSKKKKVSEKIKNLIYAFQKLCGKIKEIRTKKDYFLNLLRDEVNKATFGFLKTEIISMLRYLGPQKFELVLHFGFGDPAITGQIIGWASIFYPYFYKSVTLQPDFERKVFEGNVYVKGRVRMIRFLRTAFRFWRNKNFRKTLHTIIHKEEL